MKKRLILFVTTYLLFLVIFIFQKPLFMLYYHELYEKTSAFDFIKVMYHGLPLDLSLAGYFTIIPGLFILASAWSQSNNLAKGAYFYFNIASLLIAFIFIIDLGLYGFWGFRLDSTPLFYFFSSPKDALASVSYWFIIKGVLAIIAYGILLSLFFKKLIIKSKITLKIPYKRLSISGGILLCIGLLFIPIRGGFSVSTMNLSKVYFSQDQRMNHAAINPIFSLMYSMTHQGNFDKQYRFMEAQKADRLFNELVEQPTTDSIPQLIKTQRPNIYFIILESFSTHIMASMGGVPDVAINMDKFGKESILFTNFYANSFRTDRGLVSIISGYPAQPTTSIMKYPEKTENLPSIPSSLKNAGYDLQYYYGGDADFTNMRSYLVSSGFEKIISDKDFPLSQRTSKWGVHDEHLFNYVLKDSKNKKLKEPFLSMIQTSSSHEPFDVPYHKLNDNILNAFSYTDKCLGDFINQLKKSPSWDHTLIVLVPDHQGAYPCSADNQKIENHTIPLIFMGGAIKAPHQIDTYGSQIDIAATLLQQLGISHQEFKFSKNIFNPNSPHFGYFTVPNAFGMITPENKLVFNCESNRIQTDEGPNKGANLEKGQAFLQKLYDDLAKR
ncbi:MAG: LTA synthase family protein [Bacteroides sp.]